MDFVVQLIINSIIAGSIYTLMALGFNLTYGATKFFNLAHGVMATVGGYTVFYIAGQRDMSILLAALLGILAAGAVGYGLDRLVYSPLRKRKASNMVLLVASLGVFTALESIIAIIFSSQFQTLPSIFESYETFTILGGSFTAIHILIVFSSIACVIGLHTLLKCTMFGKAIKAVSDDEEVSKIVGINTGKLMGYVFFIGSALAGIAGVLVGFDTGVQPIMGMPLLLKGIIAAIIGGLGSLWGGVLGAFLLGFVENFGIWHISGEWKDTIAFGLLILFLIFRPQGIIKN